MPVKNPYRGDGFSLRQQTHIRNGKRWTSRFWHIRFKDHQGSWQEVSAFTDKTVSAALGRKIVKLVHHRVMGEPLPVDLARWVDGLSVVMLKKLTALRLIDPNMAERAKDLRVHVEDWRKSILAGGRTFKNANDKRRMVLAVIEACYVDQFADLDAERIKQLLADRQAEGMSDRRRNHIRQALRQFCNWMVRTGRASVNPMAHLEVVTEHKKYLRRALSAKELRALVKAAMTGEDYLRTTGPERAVVYALAASTGLRANELRSLTAGSFELDGNPTVTVQSRYAKNRKEHALPLTAELAGMLRVHLRKKLPSARAFNLPEKCAKMLRVDLAGAKIAETDERGRVFDFHALRYTFVTNLLRGGVHMRKAQLLARHSDIRLTAEVYGQFDSAELREATAALPKLA